MLRVASIFSQILHEIPRTTFESLVGKHGAERCAKGFSCWTQLVAMVFSHLARADSLREICHGLATTSGKLVHLGVGASPCRSTLSYANAHRPTLSTSSPVSSPTFPTREGTWSITTVPIRTSCAES